MKVVYLALFVASLFAQAQEADAKDCLICQEMDRIIVANDDAAASRLMSNFHFSRDKEMIPFEADAITRMTVHFNRAGLDEFTAELYVSIYRLNPAAMKLAFMKAPADMQPMLRKMLRDFGSYQDATKKYKEPGR